MSRCQQIVTWVVMGSRIVFHFLITCVFLFLMGMMIFGQFTATMLMTLTCVPLTLLVIELIRCINERRRDRNMGRGHLPNSESPLVREHEPLFGRRFILMFPVVAFAIALTNSCVFYPATFQCDMNVIGVHTIKSSTQATLSHHGVSVEVGFPYDNIDEAEQRLQHHRVKVVFGYGLWGLMEVKSVDWPSLKALH